MCRTSYGLRTSIEQSDGLKLLLVSSDPSHREVKSKRPRLVPWLDPCQKVSIVLFLLSGGWACFCCQADGSAWFDRAEARQMMRYERPMRSFDPKTICSLCMVIAP